MLATNSSFKASFLTRILVFTSPSLSDSACAFPRGFNQRADQSPCLHIVYLLRRVSTCATVSMSHALTRSALPTLFASLSLSHPMSAFCSVSVTVGLVLQTLHFLLCLQLSHCPSLVGCQLAYRLVSWPQHCPCVAKSINHCLF